MSLISSPNLAHLSIGSSDRGVIRLASSPKLAAILVADGKRIRTSARY